VRLKRTKADKLFSDYIRLRDQYKCQRCHIQINPPTNEIQCAHFHSRSKKSVRFDIENAISLCRKCHLYFDGYSAWGQVSHKKEFEEFMLKRLGQQKLDMLLYRAQKPQKIDEEFACIWLKALIKEIKPNPQVFGRAVK